MNLNGRQIISIVGAILSVMMISTAQLTDLFGAGVAKSVVSVAGLGNLVLQSIMTALTSQSSQISSVAAMPGVSSIQVNGQASSALATIAIDQANNKVEPVRGLEQQVIQAANKGA